MKMDLPALIGSGDVVVAAYYKSTDPYAITLQFPSEVCAPDWVIGRDLLVEALRTERIGSGDVRVTVRGDLVVLGLSTPDGVGWVVFRRDDVDALVAQTFRIVRPGREAEFLDWSDTTDFPGVAL
jgi:Streptomyces sporulation and cell division protein, SsgA